MSDSNPLLQDYHLPPFSAIRAEHLVPAIDTLVRRGRAEVARIIASQQDIPTWDDLVLAIEEVTSRIDGMLRVIHILDGINAETQWAEAYALATRQAADFIAELKGNRSLFECYRALASSQPGAFFNAARQGLLRRMLQKFVLAGVDLESAEKKRLVTLNREISELEELFFTHLEQANTAWSKHVTDESLLQGLAPALKLRMAHKARTGNLQGWLITLSEKTYQDCMAFAQDRTLREQIFIAYHTRASELGPHAGQFDNSPVLQLLLANRHEKARLLGYPNFAQLVLKPLVLDTSDQVLGFIRQQIALEQEAFAQDRQQLVTLGRERGLTELQPWDYAFLAQTIRQQTSGVAEDELRAYFSLDTTLVRLFELTQRLFGIEIIELADFDTWSPGVRLFQVQEFGEALGQIYFVSDRRGENTGFAHAFSLKDRWTTAESRIKQPVVVLYSGFDVQPHEPYLLGHRQLKTLFHEFGHCLQHVLMGVGYRTKMSVDELGIDSAEFCGQFFERWCDSRTCLVWLSSHYQTGAPLPEVLVQQQLVYASTQTSWARAELLTLALFDIEVHRTQGDGRSAQQVFTSANREVGHLPVLDDVRYINGFSHIVSGYEGAFYSYRWSDLLAHSAFKRFEREGVFNGTTGRAFREHVLAPGDSRSLHESLQIFLGRLPGDMP